VADKPIDRKTWIALVVSLVSMLAGIALFQLSDTRFNQAEINSAQPLAVQSETPASLIDIPLIDLKGVSQTLGDWKQPVLVINFWAPWCAPCRQEIPDLIALQREYGERIQVLGLAFDSVENIESFAEEYQMNYPSYLANQHIPMYSAVFQNKSGALPFTAIIDQNRKIGYTHTGVISLQALRQQVSKLL
jgi:thiol-disulfide isomerase/thioredoxin